MQSYFILEMERIIKNGKPKICIVDDSSDSLDALGILLDKENYNVLLYNNPKTLESNLDDIFPDLFILDVEMPEINGYDLCRKIRKYKSLDNTPVIFLTGKTKYEDIIQGFEAGGVDYIHKPFFTKELLIRIKTHLELKLSKEKIIEHSNQISKYNEELLAINQQLIDLNAVKDRYLNIIKSELSSAAEYVYSLFPQPGNLNGISTKWIFSPCTQLGGDAFDYFWIDDDNFIIFLLDVSGHGVKPALQSVSVLNILRNKSLPNIDFKKPSEVLYALNKSFQMNKFNSLYFSMWYGVFNKSNRVMTFSGAGHPPAILINGNRKIEYLSSENKFVGILPEQTYISNTHYIEPDSTLYLYSDGVFEIEKNDNKKWSMEEMHEVLLNYPIKDGTEIENLYLFTKTISINNTLKDDFSILKAVIL